MLAVGDPIPDATVRTGAREAVRLRELTGDGGSVLLVFYLFDFSST